MTELNKKIEAILFSAGDKVSLDDFIRLTKEKDKEILKKNLKIFKEIQ